jgi:hypothetical protein
MAVNDPTKFRQLYNLENQILVEADYDNIIIIDPNKVVDANGKTRDRFVQQENLVMYANLETKIIPRTKLAIGEGFDSPVNNTTIASLGSGDDSLNVNFLKPKGKNAFDTSWSDEFTGKGSRQGKGINQNKETSTTQNGNTVFQRRVVNFEDTQNLGITSISVDISSVGVPKVSMTLVDIRGRALFEQGENSLYSVFFNLPYPTFYLVLKGYYGKAIRYQLTLLSFNAKFDPDSGNFEISLELMGRNSAILSDSLVSFAKNSPKMFRTQVTTTKSSSNSGGAKSSNKNVQVTSDTIGLQKLREVYKIYESKGLIKNVPYISMEEFIARANNYDKNVQDQIKKGKFDVINDVTDYQNTLNELKQRIYLNSIQDFLDSSERIYIDGKIYYPYKESFKLADREKKKKSLNGEFDTLLKKLNENKSFGKGKEYTLPGSTTKLPGEITNNLLFKDIVTTSVDFNSISNTNFEKTYEINYGTAPTPDQLNKFITEFKTLNAARSQIINSAGNTVQSNPEVYFFGDKVTNSSGYYKNSFLDKLDVMSKNLEDKRVKIEKAFTDELSNLLINSNSGLGFNPTIRNVFAVLFAGLDGFYRMMEDVHTSAWSQRQNPVRLDAILPPGKNVGVDAITVVNGTAELNKDNIVYPWPQYFELERQSDGTEQYTIKYPGDAFSVAQTKGYSQNIWPEIAFTEEYINASLQKTTPQVTPPTGNQAQNTNYLSVSAIEFPFDTLPYQNISDVSFLYEIFERSYLGTHYSKLNRGDFQSKQIDKILSDIDAENIIQSLTTNNSPSLTSLLKNITATTNSYLNKLKTISSNGTGPSWVNYSNSVYNLPYIQNYIDSGYNKVYSVDSLNNTSISVAGNVPLADKLKEYVNGTPSSPEFFLDTYPFTDTNWLKSNLQDGQSLTSVDDFYNTKTFLYLDDKKTLARLNENENIQNINLLIDKFGFGNYVESNYLVDQQSLITIDSRDTLKTYYQNKKNEYFYFTESFVDYGTNYSGNVGTNIQTTSLLNTPYFINALQKGVEKSKNPNEKTPYVALGYLYLNSLPLITTKEKVKETTNISSVPNDLDYLAATLNKFSAIHRLPYAWVLKYGSIWHRYKKYVEDDAKIDILDDVWKDFDYLTNYDPISSATTTQYSGTWVGNIILQQTTPVPNTTTTADTITTGFYPKVINDVYRFFYNTDLSILQTPNYSNFVNISNDYGFNVVTPYNKFFNTNFDSQQSGRTLTMRSYYQYFTKPNKDDTKVLVIPSQGPLKFNQAEFECFDQTDKLKQEVFNNKKVYNGSVRSLWSAPNFGYFDNGLLKKPKYNEYLKTIDATSGKKQNSFNLKNTQSTYSTIEEIFSVFEPKILDEFEKLFLSFCDPNPVASDLILLNEQTNATTTTIGQVNNVKQKRLFNQIESLFLIEKNSINFVGDNGIGDGESISKAQMNTFAASVIEFLNFDCVLKMGNPSNFNRPSFNYFTNNNQFKPVANIAPTAYIQGTLPGDSTNTSLALSIAAKKTEWGVLKKYVGDFIEPRVTYTNTGSPITDFFIQNNVEFTVSNIETLYPLIRIYAKEKLKDPTFNKIKFTQKINTFMVDQIDFNSKVLEGTLKYLNKNLDDTKIQSNSVNSQLTGNVTKLEYYTTLKTMNDKWIAGTDFLNKTIFEDFLFLDRANRDIGDEFTIDVREMEELLNNPNKNFLDLISGILSKNNFLFFAMPAYFNFYGMQEAIRLGKPIPVDIPNSLFGTYLDVDYIDSRPKFVCVYVGKPSEHPASEAKFVRFKDDAFDLRKYDNPLRTSYGSNTNFSKNNKVVGFAVDFGIQNQSIFKGINLDMSEKKNTAESNRLVSQLGQSASGDKVAQQTVSLYSIYKARSYTSDVKCMGNAMIQPTMYFNLRHVPLFYGPYWIMSVRHIIGPGKFETSFKGVRMPIYSLPKPNSMLEAVNKSYVESYKAEILKAKEITEQPNKINENEKIKTTNVGGLQGEESECKKSVSVQYNTFEFTDIITTSISESELKTKILGLQSLIPKNTLNPLYYGLVKTKLLNSQNGVVWSTSNYNLYEINALLNYSADQISKLKLLGSKIVCITTAQEDQNVPTPYFSFNNFEESISFYNDTVKTYEPIIESLKNTSTETDISKKYAQAYTIFTLFWDQGRYYSPTPRAGYYSNLPTSKVDFLDRYTTKVKPSNPVIYKAYNDYMKIYEDAFKTFFP